MSFSGGMHRRKFLKVLGGGVGAIAALRTLVWDLQTAKSAGPTVLDSFAYKGHQVQIIQETPEHVYMTLDGRTLPHFAFMRLRPNRFSSHLLPFADEPSGRQLAKKLIDGTGTLYIL